MANLNLHSPRNCCYALLAAAALFLSACGTTSTHMLPAYEPPLSKSEFQNVRTTAYTDTEADHRQFGARNALGGELHAAGPAVHRAENVRRALPVSDSDVEMQSLSTDEPVRVVRVKTTTTRVTKKSRKVKRAIAVTRRPPPIGSAAADWSRWPMGTTFRLLSTGQIYRVEDYGWALSGRNTIDLYMATSRDMNAWGAREEPIQVLRWGDPQQSLDFLRAHQDYKHVRRMVMELEGREEEAAALQ